MKIKGRSISETCHARTACTRRRFLKWQLCGALWLASGPGLLLAPGRVGAAEPDLAVAKGGPAAATRAAVELLGGMEKFVKPGQRVVIKPNMSFASPPEAATNTHPEVVRTLVSLCQEAGAGSVFVLDNPLNELEACLQQSGIREACEPLGRGMVQGAVSEHLYQEADIPKGKSMRSNRFVKEALKADVLIAAPVAKHHGATGVSLSMKGMMGLIMDRSVMHWKYGLHGAIVDLCTRLKADLAVIDATRALTTNGPFGPGEVERLDTVVASRDMVAADAYVTEMVRWYGRSLRADQVKHLKIAHERGLGRIDVGNLQVSRVEAG